MEQLLIAATALPAARATDSVAQNVVHATDLGVPTVTLDILEEAAIGLDVGTERTARATDSVALTIANVIDSAVLNV